METNMRPAGRVGVTLVVIVCIIGLTFAIIDLSGKAIKGEAATPTSQVSEFAPESQVVEEGTKVYLTTP